MISDIFDKRPYRKSLLVSVFIIFMASCIHPTQILFSSKYYQLGLNIPVHSINMYMTKLYSVRKLFMLLGSMFEYVFHKVTGIKRIHTAMFACGMMCSMRMIIFTYIHTYDDTAVIFYYMSNAEAFISGFFQVCFQVVFARFMSIMMVSKDFSYILISVIQIILNTCFYNKPFVVILIQHFFSFIFCLFGFVLWYFFICKCREMPFVINNNFIEQLKNLLNYFKVDIVAIANKNDMIVFKDGLIGMINDKKSLLDHLTRELEKLLEHDRPRMEYAKRLINDIKEEYKYLEIVLDYEHAITADSKINSELLEFIVFSEELINSKLDMLKNLVDEAYMERRKLDLDYDIEKNLNESQMKSQEGFWMHFVNVLSPLAMIIPAMFFRQLYPNIYPYGLVERRKGNLAILVIAFGFIIGSLWTIHLEKNFWNLKDRYDCYQRAWLSLIPMLLGFVGSIVPIHTDSNFFRKVVNSNIRVCGVSLPIMSAYSIMRSTSSVYIANYITEESKNVESSSRLLSFHNIVYLFLDYLFFKMSLSYRQGKESLGYTPPNFQVNERARESHTFGFWMRYVFMRTLLEIVKDFRVKIRIYA